MQKTSTLTRSLRSRSWQTYRLLAAETEMETSIDHSREFGWRLNATVRAALVTRSWTFPVVAFGAAVTAVAGTIGPDARWLSVLGRTIVRSGAVPHGVPYAAARSSGWHNVPVLAELCFRGLQIAAGDRGLLGAQVAATVVALGLLAAEARRLGASDSGTAAALLLVVTGGLLAFAGIRAQLFALVLFPLLFWLLRSEERAPSRRIWLLVPLAAVWSNLHGTALLGVAVALVYLFAERARRRPLECTAVAVASLLALCATPALATTPAYYAGALTNEAARRGYGLWAPLTLHSGFDVVFLVAALLLLAGFVRARPRPWQFAVATALGVLTVHASRNGIWLLMFLAAPAAHALLTFRRPSLGLSHGLAIVLMAAAVAGLVRGPLDVGASSQLIAGAIRDARGGPVLAEPAVAEQIALAGGRVWISNPLDAFRQSDQRLYLDWLQGRPSGTRLLGKVTTVVVSRASPSDRQLVHDGRFLEVGKSGRFRLFASRSS
jgi:hypothetical protein